MPRKLMLFMFALFILALSWSLAAQTPSSAAIEAVSMQANQGQQAQAEKQLRAWAAQGLPVAQRELALLLLQRPQQQTEATLARELFAQAGKAGDGEAAFQLAELLRQTHPRQAWDWYQIAAKAKHAKAALMLARMAKGGEINTADAQLAAHWLIVASELGNGQAMFLLANAYQSGDGISADPKLAHAWLEKSAEADFPAAIHALALESGDNERARLLLKEANEERHNHWNGE